jgi:transcriptional antiterminator RfaH
MRRKNWVFTKKFIVYESWFPMNDESLRRQVLWYAIHTKPRQEDLAQISLQSLGLTTFNPKLKEKKIVRGVRQDVVKPLFSSYIFCKFRVQEFFRAVKYARGVREIVGTKEEPTPVDDDIISIIHERMIGGYVVIESPKFQPGDMVMVEDGPLQGFVGIFEREMKDSERVVILLNTIKFQARVVMERGKLKKL